MSTARASRSEAPLVAILRGLKPSEAEAVFGGLIGAGTVLTVEDVDSLDAAGGRLMVSPNVEPEVMVPRVRKNMITFPGVLTATEALAALKAGATGLEFLPAGVLGPLGITAIRAILPSDFLIAAVGSVSDQNFASYTKAGITAFGLGTSLYKPGMTSTEVMEGQD